MRYSALSAIIIIMTRHSWGEIQPTLQQNIENPLPDRSSLHKHLLHHQHTYLGVCHEHHFTTISTLQLVSYTYVFTHTYLGSPPPKKNKNNNNNNNNNYSHGTFVKQISKYQNKLNVLNVWTSK